MPDPKEQTASFWPSTRDALQPLPFWARYGTPVRVTFALANTTRDVAHGLGVVPDGMLLLRADAAIRAVRGKQWTDQVAYLQADLASSHATIVFFTLREDARDV